MFWFKRAAKLHSQHLHLLRASTTLHTLTYTMIKRTKDGEKLLRGFSYLSEEQTSKEFSPQEGQLLHLHKRRRERDQEAQNERREREEAENERRER